MPPKGKVPGRIRTDDTGFAGPRLRPLGDWNIKPCLRVPKGGVNYLEPDGVEAFCTNLRRVREISFQR